MKIPVKVVKMVEVEVVKIEDIDIDLTIGINYLHSHFQDVINYLLTLKFVESSCDHTRMKDFISRSQGGVNSSNITDIQLLAKYQDYKYTFSVKWGTSDSAYIILSK